MHGIFRGLGDRIGGSDEVPRDMDLGSLQYIRPSILMHSKQPKIHGAIHVKTLFFTKKEKSKKYELRSATKHEQYAPSW